MAQTPVIHIDDVALEDFGNGGKFEAKLGRIGPVIGAEKLGCMLTIVPPGKCAFPCHNHHVIEEMIVILEGEGEYRFGEDRHAVKAGAVIAAPPGGRDRAHQLINTGASDLKYLCMSTAEATDVVEYPDSNKVGAVTWNNETGTPDFRHRAYAQEVDYWAGEE